jgi:NTE family protein
MRRAGVLPRPNRVEAQGADTASNRTIEAALSQYVDESLDLTLLEADLNRIYGWGRFSRLDYGMAGEAPSALLQIQALPKTGGSPLILLGIAASNVETDDVNFSVQSRVTFLDIGRYGAEWRIDTSVGTNLRASSEYYAPVGRGFFVAPRVFAWRAHSSLFSDGQRLAEYKESMVGAGLDLGWGFGRRRSEIRFGYLLGQGDSEVRIGDPLLPDAKGTVSRAHLSWRFDDRDDSVVPRRGLQVEWSGSYSFQSPGSESGFSQSELEMSFFQPLASPNSLFFRAGGGTTFSRTAPPLQQFRLGGPFHLGAFGKDEFRGSRYLLVSPGYLHELLPLPLFVGKKLFATAWHEVGAVFEREESRDFRNSFTVGVVADTVLGPFFLGSSWGEGGRNKFYFALGRLF